MDTFDACFFAATSVTNTQGEGGDVLAVAVVFYRHDAMLLML